MMVSVAVAAVASVTRNCMVFAVVPPLPSATDDVRALIDTFDGVGAGGGIAVVSCEAVRVTFRLSVKFSTLTMVSVQPDPVKVKVIVVLL